MVSFVICAAIRGLSVVLVFACLSDGDHVLLKSNGIHHKMVMLDAKFRRSSLLHFIERVEKVCMKAMSLEN